MLGLQKNRKLPFGAGGGEPARGAGGKNQALREQEAPGNQKFNQKNLWILISKVPCSTTPNTNAAALFASIRLHIGWVWLTDGVVWRYVSGAESLQIGWGIYPQGASCTFRV